MKTYQRWLVHSFFIAREFLGFQLLFTGIGVLTIWSWQAYSIPIVFWVKLAGYAIQAVGYWQFRSGRFMFFYNLGIGKSEIVKRVLLLDLVISLMFFIPAYELFTD